MPLTFPAVYAAKTKLKNIEEDWLVQLGFDEAFSKATSLLAEALDDSETGVDVDTGSEFAAGDYIKIDSEIMYVSSIASNTLTVIRGARSTEAAAHNDNSEIYFDNYIGVTGTNRIVSDVQYYGIIEDYGAITQKIDIENSKASTGYVNMKIINQWKTGKLSDILYGGTNTFLNRKVKIYSCLGNETTLSNCALLFEGMLTGVAYVDEMVYLNIEQKTPWDYIEIAKEKTSNGITIPIVYGDYTGVNDSSTFANLGTYHPVPVDRIYNRHIFCINHKNETSQTILHYYEEAWDVFAPMTDDNGSAVEIESDIYALLADYDLDREFKARPPAINTTTVLNDEDNAIDDEGDSTPTTYGYKQHTGMVLAGSGSQNLEDTTEFEVECPVHGLGHLDSFVVGSNIYMKAEIVYAANPGGMTADIQARCRDNSYNQNDDFSPHADYHSSGGSTGYDEVAQTDQTLEIISEYTADDEQMPLTISLKMRSYLTMEGTVAGDEVEAECTYWIYDMWVILKAILDYTNNPGNCYKILADLKYLYSASDGFTKDYTDGGGTVATLAHEIHRDMMNRFAGLDYDNDYMANWSDLNTARSGWTCRWWTLQLMKLKEILEKIQFEGCFIFLLTADSDGSGNPGGKYIWVKDSYNSGDIEHTFEDEIDYKNIKISTTDIKDIITDTKYNYLRHPATNDYREDRTYNNSTARTKWAISSLENKEVKNLNFITADVVYESGSHTNPNDCIALYYDNIKANPRIIIDCDITNPAKSDVELGDIDQFNDSKIDPYGKSWSDLYFMAIEMRRSPGNISVKYREVYEA